MEEKKKASWKLDNAMLAVTMPTGETTQYNLGELFTNFEKLTGTQQNTVAYGVKQKLSDSTARGKDEKLDAKGSIEVMNETFAEILDGTAWTRKGGGGFSLKKEIQTKTETLNKKDQAELKRLLKEAGLNIF